MDIDREEKFVVDGLTFRMCVVRDDNHREPWKEHEGHGPVSEWTTRNKLPSELVLVSDGGNKRFYDYAAAVKIAKRDAWGIDPTKTEGMTPNQIRVAAVERDYKYLKAWCKDEWWWVGVTVDLLDVDGTPVPLPDAHASLWGIESDNEDYHMEVAKELASEIAETYKGQNSIPLVIRKV